jgi:hypothetical protein
MTYRRVSKEAAIAEAETLGAGFEARPYDKWERVPGGVWPGGQERLRALEVAWDWGVYQTGPGGGFVWKAKD